MKTPRTFLLKLLTISLTGCLAAALAPVSTAWAGQPHQRTVRASVSSIGAQGNGNSTGASLANHGRFVAFTSEASNLVAEDHNGATDIFVHDLKARRTKRVSVSSTGGEANGTSYSPVISTNGRYVVFLSDASNLVTDDNNGMTDLFVHDTQTGSTRRVFLDGLVEDSWEYGRAIYGISLSDNGRFLAFGSGIYNSGVYLSDLKTGVTQALLNAGPGEDGVRSILSLSGDGHLVAFNKAYSPCDYYAIILRDLKTGAQRCVLGSYEALFFGLTLSANGRFLSYSYTTDYTTVDVYVKDVNTLANRLVSVNRAGVAGNGKSFAADLAANGRLVAFESLASDLVARDSNDASDVFVRDLKARVTHRVSVNSAGRQGNNGSSGASISANGRLVAFTSEASNLVKKDTNGKTDVFVRLWRR